MSESTMEMRTPPMTAIASGCSICDPAPMAKASGNIPATVAKAVMTMGRNRRRAACSIAFSVSKPKTRIF